MPVVRRTTGRGRVPVVTEGLQPLPHDVGGFPDGLTEIGLRTGRYAYFRYSTGEGELYDLKRDPLQLRSRYDDPAYESVRRDLTKLWRQYRACAADACRAPLPAEYQVSVAELADLAARASRARAATTAEAAGRDTRLDRVSRTFGALQRLTKGQERRRSWGNQTSGSSGCLRLRSRSRRKSASSSGAMGRVGGRRCGGLRFGTTPPRPWTERTTR